MHVLVACEFSGRVRDAFTALGHAATSCDLLPSETPGNHYQSDVRDILDYGWDLMIAHPPCTYLANAGARWNTDPLRREMQQHAIGFFLDLYNADIPHIAIENPVGVMSTVLRRPDQYVNPYMFGHPDKKRTGLWLKNLPLLTATYMTAERRPTYHHMSPSPDRSRLRSITCEGLAQAMATQWSTYLTSESV